MPKIILIIVVLIFAYEYNYAQDGYVVKPSPKGGAYIVYTIQKGDNLTNIARNSGINLKNLLGANPNYSKTTIIHPGEQILIPLNTEQILSKDKNLDPSFIPLYYQIQP
ncbi:MAG: LysM peptidoglycan-binding domain-containing protein, partial [Chitinophagaceae bacterium]